MRKWEKNNIGNAKLTYWEYDKMWTKKNGNITKRNWENEIMRS